MLFKKAKTLKKFRFYGVNFVEAWFCIFIFSFKIWFFFDKSYSKSNIKTFKQVFLFKNKLFKNFFFNFEETLKNFSEMWRVTKISIQIPTPEVFKSAFGPL